MKNHNFPLAREPDRAPKGIPMGLALTVLVFLVILIVAIVGGGWYYIQHDRIRVERELAQARADTMRAELAATKAAQNSGLALAKTHQEELLGQARSATNVLTQLMVETARLTQDAADLKENQAGKKVALFPDLVVQSRRFHETDLPELASRPDIITKLEGARRIELQLVEAIGTIYEPDPEIKDTIQSMKSWGKEALQKTMHAREIFSTIVAESKIKVTEATVTESSATLARMMERFSMAETETIQRLLNEKAGDSKLDAARIAAESAEEKKQKILLRKKANDPKIRIKLAPFITPGYAQIYHDTLDRKPLSYKDLQARGALNPDFAGIDILIRIAMAPLDKVRPRWMFNRNFYRSKPEVLEMVKETQQLLIELGPTLVEMGLLQP